jgi:RimJ/RimL family protein N-acetyltransferase
VTRKSDGALLGRCGCSHLETPVEPEPDGTYLGYYYPARAPQGTKHIVQQELGYTLDRAAWGNGYAREAVRAMWNYFSSRRPGLQIVSLIHPDNTRSIRLASSFGVKRVDRINYVGRIYDRYVWPAGNKPSMER